MVPSKGADPISHSVPIRTLALALAVVMFVMGADLNIVSPFLIDISRSFHVTLAATGWLVTAFAAGYTLASPLAGWMSDRTGRLPTLLAGMIAFVVFETASGLAPTLLTEAASRALAGITAGAVSPVAYSLVGDVVPKPERPRVMAILSMGFSASTVAGVPLGLLLSTAVGWRGTLLAIAGALAMSGIGLVLLLTRMSKIPAIPRQSSSRSATELLLQTWPQLTASFMAFAAMGLVYTYLPTTLLRRGVPNTTWLMAVLAGYGLFNLIGNAIFGRLGESKGAATAVRIAQWIEISMLALLALAAAWGSLAIAIAASWLFAASQAYIPDLKALAANVPIHWRGTSLALNNTAMYSGMMVGSAIANAVFHQWGFPLTASLGGVAIALGIASMHRRRRLAPRAIQGV
ncbi:MFS transporter [Sulfobacillus harzensis]|uniref:MFS transporter n=1 Tax=Sulfobacillus harzensis TaxID=2729629 RepID=A0A7Y0L7H4_9FIRM|nr:MFS transporter [Sulfobacillus harzensis]NMP24732.1 MFS transporter [Sulfobacillus harzensis]